MSLLMAKVGGDPWKQRRSCLESSFSSSSSSSFCEAAGHPSQCSLTAEHQHLGSGRASSTTPRTSSPGCATVWSPTAALTWGLTDRTNPARRPPTAWPRWSEPKASDSSPFRVRKRRRASCVSMAWGWPGFCRWCWGGTTSCRRLWGSRKTADLPSGADLRSCPLTPETCSRVGGTPPRVHRSTAAGSPRQRAMGPQLDTGHSVEPLLQPGLKSQGLKSLMWRTPRCGTGPAAPPTANGRSIRPAGSDLSASAAPRPPSATSSRKAGGARASETWGSPQWRASTRPSTASPSPPGSRGEASAVRPLFAAPGSPEQAGGTLGSWSPTSHASTADRAVTGAGRWFEIRSREWWTTWSRFFEHWGTSTRKWKR